MRHRLSPRAALALNPVRLALGLTRSELRSFALRDQLAFADLAAGRADAQALDGLRHSARLARGLAVLGYGVEVEALADAAAAVLERAHCGELQPHDLQAVQAMLEALDAQRSAAPRGRILQAAGLIGWR